MINTESLKKTADFQKVYKSGKSVADKNIVVYVRKNDLNMNRLGISCSKKVGNSIVRHRFSRLIREVYRLHENIFNSGLDIVVVARNRAKEANYFDIEKSFLTLAGKSHLRKNDEVNNNEENTNISN
ncbi:MAG: ribonuclease P protein component [Butyrivibrio sp.]|nr:ribonuclease P protein component [Butyrivibrio sp.]